MAILYQCSFFLHQLLALLIWGLAFGCTGKSVSGLVLSICVNLLELNQVFVLVWNHCNNHVKKQGINKLTDLIHFPTSFYLVAAF